MSGSNLYEYALVRYLPDRERGEFVNIGLVMMCKRRRWIRMATSIVPSRLLAVKAIHTPDEIEPQLDGLRRVASQRVSSGPFADLPAEERFRWITAAKSACICTSSPHPGLTTDDLDSTFDRLFASLVE